MTKKQTPVPDDKEQANRFIETAKQIGADESGKVFEQAMKILSVPPTKKPEKK